VTQIVVSIQSNNGHVRLPSVRAVQTENCCGYCNHSLTPKADVHRVHLACLDGISDAKSFAAAGPWASVRPTGQACEICDDPLRPNDMTVGTCLCRGCLRRLRMSVVVPGTRGARCLVCDARVRPASDAKFWIHPDSPCFPAKSHNRGVLHMVEASGRCGVCSSGQSRVYTVVLLCARCAPSRPQGLARLLRHVAPPARRSALVTNPENQLGPQGNTVRTPTEQVVQAAETDDGPRLRVWGAGQSIWSGPPQVPYSVLLERWRREWGEGRGD